MQPPAAIPNKSHEALPEHSYAYSSDFYFKRLLSFAGICKVLCHQALKCSSTGVEQWYLWKTRCTVTLGTITNPENGTSARKGEQSAYTQVSTHVLKIVSRLKSMLSMQKKNHNRGTFARNMKWPTKYRKHLMQQNLYWKVLNHEHLHNSHQPEACCWQAFLIFLSEFFGGYIPSQVCIRGSPACYNTYPCNRVKQWAEHLLLPHSHLIPALGFISHYPRAPVWLTLPWMHWYLHPTWHFTGPQTPLLLSTLALGSDTTEPWSGQGNMAHRGINCSGCQH